MLVDGVFGLEQGVGHQLAGMLVGEAVEDTLPLLGASRSLARCWETAVGVLSTASAICPTESSRSCSARMMRTLVGSASIEKTATARSMYSGSGEPRTGLSAFMCR